MNNKNNIKAIGLISGGLDSLIAAKFIESLGIEVIGITFLLPWSSSKEPKAVKFSKEINLNIRAIQLDDRYIDMLKKPKYGYGCAYNPCIDCKIFMLSQAKEIMEQEGASFIFTGEVVGQRPMSQVKDKLNIITKESNLKGLLLRPLSAKLLDPTIAEENGIIDREKLLDISGRGRKRQYELAEKFGIKSFGQPAGGCLLTENSFGNKLKDVFNHNYRGYNDTISLKWGRHFRLNENTRLIIGRDQRENRLLEEFAFNNDLLIRLKDAMGPFGILISTNPTEDAIKTAGGIIQSFSKAKKMEPQSIEYWTKNNPKKIKVLTCNIIDNVNKFWIQ